MSSRSTEDDSRSPAAPWSQVPWSPTLQTPASTAFPVSPLRESHSGGISAPHSLAAAVSARKHEYIRKRAIKIKVGTWNVAALNGTEDDLGAWFVDGQRLAGLSRDQSPGPSEERNESVDDQEHRRPKTEGEKTTSTPLLPKEDVPAMPQGDEIGLYALGLQEIIDVTSVTEAVKPYTDPNPAKKWKDALEKALPDGYVKVAEQQLLGLLILIYASPALAPTISSASATSIGTGLMGYLGNKGAVAVRIVLADTTRLSFINCHLAAGADQAALNRRIWDTNQIMTRTRFSPVSLDGAVVEGGEEKIGDEDVCFWFGDLNYRLDDIPGEDVRRLLLLHTRNEYDLENKSKYRIDSEFGYISAASSESKSSSHDEYDDSARPAPPDSPAERALEPESDPASLHTTLQSLLAHDQLRKQQRLHRAFHDGWREGEITFLPTYKYDIGSVGMFDSGEKQRGPSWCDRILFRTRRDKEAHEKRAQQEAEARRKDEAMKAQGLDQAAAEQDVLFDYDPDLDGLAYGDDYEDYDEREDAYHDAELVQTREDVDDAIELDHYVSYQRVLSSDHKPLAAIFTLTYDAVIPELKAQVHQEVARELDKAENEGRPAVTVVVDNQSDDSIPPTDDTSIAGSDVNVVHFGQVRYMVRKSRMVTIANTGQIPATFRFVERTTEAANETRALPSWLDVEVYAESSSAPVLVHDASAQEYTVSPGETTGIELSLELSDPELVHNLNDGNAELDDILVLRITGGRDHFIPVKATWLYSCFCRTLDELVLVPAAGGVRSLPRIGDAGGTDETRLATHHSAPRELYALTEAIPGLVERAVAEWDMIHEGETPPWQPDDAGGDSWPFSPHSWTFPDGVERWELCAALREALDTATPFAEHLNPELSSLVRLELLAETLLLFLRGLRDGILTQEMWSDVDQRLAATEKAKAQADSSEVQEIVMDALSQASSVHSVSFTFLTFMLDRILSERIPAPAEGALPNPSRRSQSSTISADSVLEPDTTPASDASAKRGFFPSLRRRRTQSTTSSSGYVQPDSPALERRKRIVSAYAEIFAPVVIRSEQDATVKGKDKKTLDARKRRVLQSFLDPPQA